MAVGESAFAGRVRDNDDFAFEGFGVEVSSVECFGEVQFVE